MAGMRLRWRMILGALVLAVIAVLITGTLAARLLARDALSAATAGLERESSLLVTKLAPVMEDPAALTQAVAELGEASGTHYTVFDLSGEPVADSLFGADGLSQQQRPEVIQALEVGLAYERRHTTGGQEILVVGRRIERRVDRTGVAQALGVVTATRSLGSMEQGLDQLSHLVLGAILITACLAVIGGLLLGRSTVLALRRMARAANEFATGAYDRRIEIQGNEESDQLGSALNRMADELQHRFETINAERNRLDAMLGAMAEGVIAIDDHELVVHSNASAVRQLDMVDNGMGRRVWEACRVHQVPRNLAKALADGETNNETVRLTNRGRDRHLELSCSPVRDAEGRLIGALAVVHDQTELRHLEQVRRDFVANVSHELKTPLTAIRGVVETMLDDQDMPAAIQRRFIGKIDTNADRLAAIVTDLLSLSRLENDASLSSQESVDLHGIVRRSVADLRDRANERSVELSEHHGDEACSLVGDEDWLRQAIDNLVVNAITYTPPGGHVRVSISCRDNQVSISVTDDGIGIDSTNLERIWERFYRVDRARSRALGGTGLGLAIVKHVAIVHGGDVEVQSRPGEGSTFTITMPLLPVAEPAAASSQDPR